MGQFERMAVSTEWLGTVSVGVSQCLLKSDVARVDPSREDADSRVDLLSSKLGQYERQGIRYLHMKTTFYWPLARALQLLP